MQNPKVVVIGAGSLFFGRQAIWQMAHSEHLNGGTLGLVDTNPVTLKRMATLAGKVIEHQGVKLALEVSTDAKEVLKDALELGYINLVHRSKTKAALVDIEYLKALQEVYENYLDSVEFDKTVNLKRISLEKHEKKFKKEK